jgi:hypothetical protein
VRLGAWSAPVPSSPVFVLCALGEVPMQAAYLRFSTARLFYFVILCAAATALLGWLGVLVGCFVMLIWIQVLAGARREQVQAAEQVARAAAQRTVFTEFREGSAGRNGVSRLELLVVSLIAALVVGLLIPAAPDVDLQQQAATSMSMVAKAVEAYEQHFGAPPPPVVWAEDGTPWHSWRALILPFLGEEKLAAAYRWDEPWNGPHNQRLAQYRPWHYRSCCEIHETSSRTKEDLDWSRTSTALHLCPGAVAGKMLVLEHEQAASSWLQPSQLDGWQELTTEPDPQTGFWHHGFFCSSYRGRLAADSHQAWRIHPQTSLSAVLAQFSVSREQLPTTSIREFVEVGKPLHQWHMDNAMRLTVFLAVVLYPLRWLAQGAAGSAAEALEKSAPRI